jgi:hypothetical protein
VGQWQLILGLMRQNRTVGKQVGLLRENWNLQQADKVVPAIAFTSSIMQVVPSFTPLNSLADVIHFLRFSSSV